MRSHPGLSQTLGSLRKPQRRWQRKRRQTQGSKNRTITLHMRYEILVHLLAVLYKTKTENDQKGKIRQVAFRGSKTSVISCA